MVKNFCDRCGVKIKGGDTYNVGMTTINTIEKEICPSCYEMWKEAFYRFFQRQGQ